mgnify:CR=1 FL=1
MLTFEGEQEKRNEASATAKNSNPGTKIGGPKAKSTKKVNIPTSPFELIDQLLEAFAASRFNSLQAFCVELVAKNGTAGTSMLKTEFTEEYQSWCMSHDHVPMEVDEHLSTLEANGLVIEPQRTSKTGVFIKIKWKVRPLKCFAECRSSVLLFCCSHELMLIFR